MLKFITDLDRESVNTLQTEMIIQADKHGIKCDDITDIVNNKVDDVADLLEVLGLMYDNNKIVRCTQC